METPKNILLQYQEKMKTTVDLIPRASVLLAVKSLQKARENRSTVYVAGNGGSACNASHLVLHLTDAGIRAIDLSGQSPQVSAYANDFGYKEIFVRQAGSVERGDVLVILSGSGSSINVMRLLEDNQYQATYVDRIALLGFSGGQILAQGLSNIPIHVVSDNYGMIEDCHSMIIHMIHEALRLA